MERKLIMLALSVLIVGSCIAPAMAQQPMDKYNVFLNFFSYRSVDSVKVTVYDQTGQVVATATSPFGGQIAISFLTPTPINSLTASASGRVSIGSSWDQYARFVEGSNTIFVGTSELYYWITVWMH